MPNLPSLETVESDLVNIIKIITFRPAAIFTFNFSCCSYCGDCIVGIDRTFGSAELLLFGSARMTELFSAERLVNPYLNLYLKLLVVVVIIGILKDWCT